MTRDEATQRVLADVEMLVRHGNGVKFRDGQHTVEVLEGRVRAEIEPRPIGSWAALMAAADLLRIAVERLTTEAPT